MAPGSALSQAAPFVLTLEMDGEAFARFSEARRLYYAPERNLVPAHVTLFHRLPGDRQREVKALVKQAADAQRPMEIEVGEAEATERGVAFMLRSRRLQALRDGLAREFAPWLDENDRSGFRPHVTVQSNVAAATARQTQRALARTFRLRRMLGLGLHLWRYRNGPWEDVQIFRFR